MLSSKLRYAAAATDNHLLTAWLCQNVDVGNDSQRILAIFLGISRVLTKFSAAVGWVTAITCKNSSDNSRSFVLGTELTQNCPRRGQVKQTLKSRVTTSIIGVMKSRITGVVNVTRPSENILSKFTGYLTLQKMKRAYVIVL